MLSKGFVESKSILRGQNFLCVGGGDGGDGVGIMNGSFQEIVVGAGLKVGNLLFLEPDGRKVVD